MRAKEEQIDREEKKTFVKKGRVCRERAPMHYHAQRSARKREGGP